MDTASRLFHNVFQAAPIGIVLENLHSRPLFVNPALCSMRVKGPYERGNPDPLTGRSAFR